MPDWLLPSVREQAQKLFASAPPDNRETSDLLYRLTADERMREVWGQQAGFMDKRRDGTGAFVYPAIVPDEFNPFIWQRDEYRRRAADLREQGSAQLAEAFETAAAECQARATTSPEIVQAVAVGVHVPLGIHSCMSTPSTDYSFVVRLQRGLG